MEFGTALARFGKRLHGAPVGLVSRIALARGKVRARATAMGYTRDHAYCGVVLLY